jgi:hypothetical protein
VLFMKTFSLGSKLSLPVIPLVLEVGGLELFPEKNIEIVQIHTNSTDKYFLLSIKGCQPNLTVSGIFTHQCN